MITIDALLFDLDGTLIDSKRDLANAVRHLQRLYGRRQSSEREVAGFIGDGVLKLVQRALPEVSAARLPEAVERFKQHYREHCLDATRLYPGVLPMLRHFRGKKMAVVTNKPVRISGRILHGLKLDPYFDLLIGGDSLPNKKPHPEPVLSALKSLQMDDPRRVVMVGDGVNDVLAGRAAGVRTVGVRSAIGDPRQLAAARPDRLISKIGDLIRFFR